MNLKSNEKIFVSFILLLAAIIKLSAVIVLGIEPEGDFASYMNMAKTMMSTGHMDDTMGNVAYYSSGYPLFLIPFFAIFNDSPETAQFVNVGLGIISVLLVYLCSRNILPSWKWATIPTILWATYPPAILYTEYISKENLMAPLLLLQTLLLLHYPSSQYKTILSILLGIVFGIELLVGPAIILTGILIGLIVTGINIRKLELLNFNWKRISIFSLACIITLAPWLSYTNSKLGKPILNTNGGFNLYLGNNPNAAVNFVGIQDTPMGPDWHSLHKEAGEVKSMSYLKSLAIEYILENPTKTLWLSLKKIAYFWFPPIHESKYGNQTKQETIIRFVWLLYYILILSTALVPLFFLKKLTRSHATLYLTALLYCVIHAAAYVIFRYRFPIMPIMCILSGSGILFLCTWWNTYTQIIYKK